jgi:hypothetical protein
MRHGKLIGTRHPGDVSDEAIKVVTNRFTYDRK